MPLKNLTFDLKSIRNLIFDLGDDLVRVNQDATEKYFKDLGATNLPALFKHASKMIIVDYQTGKLSIKKFRTTVRSSIGLPKTVTDEQFDQAWSATVGDFPKGRLQLMRMLRKDSGYRVYLSSNSDAILTEYVNEVCLKGQNDSLNSFFDKVVFSHEIGHLKQSKEAFDWILKDQHLVAGETLFLDDKADNVDAAKSCGLKAVQVDVGTDLSSLVC